MDNYSGLTETELRVVEELANKGGRSYADVASAVGISERQLYRIRQKSYIKKAVRERAISELEEDVPDIMKSLRKNAKKGDFRSIELIVKMLGMLVDRSEVKQTTTIEDSRFNDMSQEELDAEIKAIENDLKVIQGGAK